MTLLSSGACILNSNENRRGIFSETNCNYISVSQLFLPNYELQLYCVGEYFAPLAGSGALLFHLGSYLRHGCWSHQQWYFLVHTSLFRSILQDDSEMHCVWICVLENNRENTGLIPQFDLCHFLWRCSLIQKMNIYCISSFRYWKWRNSLWH